MSGGLSSAAKWFTQLEPVPAPQDLMRRPDDPRLGEIIEFWQGDRAVVAPGRAVLVGFPQDEGVRRNGGRVGAAKAPDEIRKHLFRLTTGDASRQVELTKRPPLDLGNVRVSADLEKSQESLGLVVGEVLKSGATP